MEVFFKEIKTKGFLMWACYLNKIEVARSWSLPGVRMRVLQLIRSNNNGRNRRTSKEIN
jgi:hypothetical protein